MPTLRSLKQSDKPISTAYGKYKEYVYPVILKRKRLPSYNDLAGVFYAKLYIRNKHFTYEYVPNVFLKRPEQRRYSVLTIL